MRYFLILLLVSMGACNTNSSKSNTATEQQFAKGTFGYDLDFLKKYHEDLVVLSDDNGSAQIIISPAYQARVMTSTSQGNAGASYGWINHDLIASQKHNPHINAFGGEERFWLGPEGGQFAIFFKKGSKFDMASWQTPDVIDTVAYPLVSKQADKATFKKDFEVENFSGTRFKVSVNREISLLNQKQAETFLKIPLREVQWVGYQTANELKNIGQEDWDKAKGVLSIWLLGMMNASPANIIVIPFRKGQAHHINDAYFGKIPADRLVKKDSVLLFKADANARGKIGIPPQALKPIAGSYDTQNKILTILQFDYDGATDYVNSMWEIQKHPYKGDVLNAYNDGQNETGTQMGKFYELESSSPAVALKKGEVVRHVQRTFHFEGEESQLEALAKHLLGVSLHEIRL